MRGCAGLRRSLRTTPPNCRRRAARAAATGPSIAPIVCSRAPCHGTDRRLLTDLTPQAGCATAEGPDEVLICQSDRLSRLDERPASISPSAIDYGAPSAVRSRRASADGCNRPSAAAAIMTASRITTSGGSGSCATFDRSHSCNGGRPPTPRRHAVRTPLSNVAVHASPPVAANMTEILTIKTCISVPFYRLEW
jgi:hypothetical protein